MSYALFWIETLIVALLWAGAGIAIAARVRRSLGYGLLALVVVFLPLLILGTLTLLTAKLKYFDRIVPNRFDYCAWLTIVYFLGACILLYLASRRSPDALPRLASAWPAGRLTLALLVAAGVWAMTLWNMDLAVRTQMLALRAEAGATISSVAPPVVNDAQNAALVYERAFRILDADKSLNSTDPSSPRNWDKPNFDDPAVGQFLARHTETVALLKRAADLPDCYFDHDFTQPWIAILLPELVRLRMGAWLLQLHARQQLSQGQIEAAISDVNALLRISEHTGRNPLLINALVSIAIEAMAIQTLEELLPAISTPQQVLQVKLGDSERMARLLRRALATEEAFGMATFCDLTEGRFTPQMLMGDSSAMGGSLVMQSSNALFRVFLLGDDVLTYRQVMSRNRQLALKPYYETHESLQQTEREANQGPRGVLTALMLPSLTRAFSSVAIEQARLEAARIGLAIARYRMERGQLPAKLEDLCPTFLNEIPTDPFDGQPMRLKIDDEQAVAYSVGPDQKDDGGAKSESRNLPGDISFQAKKGK